MEQKDLENRFTYHAPRGDQPNKYETIRSFALAFATALNELCPDSREKSLAIVNLEQAVMWANASIARNDYPQHRQADQEQPVVLGEKGF